MGDAGVRAETRALDDSGAAHLRDDPVRADARDPQQPAAARATARALENSILREQGPTTLELVLLALAWAFAFGVPLGVIAALRSGTLLDRSVTLLTAVTMGVPNFFVATVLGWLLAVKFGFVPTYGWDGWRAKLLPSFVLGLVPLSLIARVLRAEMLEVLGSDYVRAVRAKGLRRSRVVSVHVLRPALIPVVSLTGPLLGSLVTGLFVVEYVFAIPASGATSSPQPERVTIRSHSGSPPS